MSITSMTIHANFTAPSSATDPGRWSFDIDPITAQPGIEYQLHYMLTAPAGWRFQAVTLRRTDVPESQQAAMTVQPGFTSASEDFGWAQASVFAFTGDMFDLHITNTNRTGSQITLGMSLTVGNGTMLRTSQDPQVVVPPTEG